MTRSGWLIHIVFRSLAFRRGRTLLLLSVVAMAASLVTALGIVSDSMGERVAEELRKYGANLVIIPEATSTDPGGISAIGTASEPAWLDQGATASLLGARRDLVADWSLHLRGVVRCDGVDLASEGVDFAALRRLHPWWQVKGGWPATGEEVLLGNDLAASLSLRPGDSLSLAGPGGSATVTVAGIVAVGGDEDRLLLLPLETLQGLLGLPGKISQARLVAVTGKGPLARAAAALQSGLPGARVREVRQVARTSEELLRKVQLLMLLVTVVVVVTSGASVAGTMGTTVLERGREIGLLKAMGGARRGVLLIFALEAAAFGVAGGVAGYLLGVGIAAVIMTTVFSAGIAFSPMYLPVAVGTGLALVLIGSLGPLMAVFRLDPVQSLRGE